MYVLVREDLDPIYRSVQGTHAVAQFYEKGNDTNWHNETLVQVQVKNKEAIEYWAWKLERKNKKFVPFYEPDLENQLTAIACVDEGNIFKSLQISS
jgi:hypothetical protein